MMDMHGTAINRRHAIGAGLAAAGAVFAGNTAADERRISQLAPTKDGYTALGPDEALEYLIEGNQALQLDTFV